MNNGNKFAVLLLAAWGVYGMLGCESKSAGNNQTAKVKEVKTLYQCPMHPQIIRDHPGVCPICGMTLVPISADVDSMGHNHDSSAFATVRIDPAVVQNIGVRTEIAERRRLAPEIRLDGRVTADESRLRSVTARVTGYVEVLHASVSGQTVRQGESLLEMYSPDLVSAQEELLQALRYQGELPLTAAPPLRESAGELVQSARRRLLNWGVSESFEVELEKTGRVARRVPIASPITGSLLRKNVVEGQSVAAGAEMFQIADLAKVWVAARVYQQDLASVRIGSPVALHFRNLPGRDFSGRVFFISPEMDPVTRTAEIRVELANTHALDLRPEMFAEVIVQVASDSVLAVPEQALIRSGTRDLVIISLGEGLFEPREVRVGRAANGYAEILDGLGEGENIVVSAQFLIDSESNLRAAVEQLRAGDPMSIEKTPHSGFLTAIIAGSIRNRVLVLLAGLLLLLGGLWAVSTTPVDAIPDLSDAQVIVYTEYQGQSPRTIEDQVTYPLTTALVSVPGAKTVRGYSFFGYSLVYVLFADGTDPYWARSRVVELLNSAQKRMPPDVTPVLGPDGSGVGWVFEYALVSNRRSLQELRSLQDWYLKYGLASVEGVAEVASVGGYVKQYQVQVDPNRLRSFGVSLPEVEMAIHQANSDVGGEVLEMGEMEYMVRGQGLLRGVEDLLKVPVKYDPVKGVAVILRDLAVVSTGPEMRRGLAELDGRGEVAGGVVVMRQGQNALKVIQGVKKKLEELRAGLPDDVQIVPVYDRSGLITRAVDNLRNKLLEEMLMVALVCGLFLFHARSALVAVFTLPAAVLMAFLVMRLQGIHANIMSLGGIAIAVGAMVDGAIILIENTHKHLEHEAEKPPEQRRDHWTVVIEAASEVGPALFWSLLVITVSFLPVFVLGEQEGKMFKPLAFTKTYAMAASALLAVTVVPILLGYFVRGGIRPEARNPINRWLKAAYRPVAEFSLRRPKTLIAAAVLLVLATAIPFMKLGSEFMPPLFEGDILYMPTTLPGLSVTKARELLQQTDKILKSFPEVEQVFGKIGRAETATDPAGLDMIETTIRLKPEKEWRSGMTVDKLIAEMDRSLRLPGLTNAWTMPIKNRIDMLSTGIKTPVGIKISGPDLDTLARVGRDVEAALGSVPGTSSAFAERPMGGNYLDIRVNRERAARYGLNVADVQAVITTAIGGMPVTTTIEGLERYSVNLRYSRELRDDLPALRRVSVPRPGGGDVPLEEVADIRISQGPMVIRTEDTRPNTWVFVDLSTSDLGGYVRRARVALAENVRLPEGYSLAFSGQYEYLERSQRTLLIVIPLTLLLIIMLLYLNTRSLARTAIVLCAVPFSLVGAVWLLYLLGYNLSLAAWLGMIALAGLDAETGVVMLLYLDRAVEAFTVMGRLRNVPDLKDAIRSGAVQRVRPKIMTAGVILAGLVPILWSHGTGSDVMKRIAAPMVGGVVTSVLLELAVYPALYLLWQKRKLPAG